MLDPAQLAALAAVHRRGSFDLAAAELHVTPSAISQRIKALEETTGTLLIRRGQPCAATDTGLRLIRHHDEIALLERTLAQDLPGLAPGPATLRIAVNADSLATWFPPAMTALDALFDLVVDDQDHSRDWLRQGQVSAALSSDSRPVPGCDVAALGKMRYLAMATPAFIARHFPAGPTAAALCRAPAVIFNHKDAAQSRWAEAVTGSRPHLTGHHVPASEAFVRVVALGLGWGMIPEAMIRPGLTALSPEPLDIPLYWHVQRALKPALAPLTAAMKRAAEDLRP